MALHQAQIWHLLLSNRAGDGGLVLLSRSQIEKNFLPCPSAFILGVTLVIVSLCSGQSTASPNSLPVPGFRVFDAMRFTNRPDLRKYGIEPIRIIYTAQIWRDRIGIDRMPPVENVRRLAQAIRARQDKWGDLVILNVEHWRLRGDFHDVSANLDKYKTLLSMFREYAPGFRFGYYGTVPIVDFMRAYQPYHPRHQEWRYENSRLRPLAEKVDALFPSLYPRRKDIESWVEFARAQISEARQYSPAKPVYVFLMPQYHPSAKRQKRDPEELVDAAFWRVQLETAAELADGVVLWGGKNLTIRKPLEWNENSPWWKETKEFLRLRRATKVSTNRDESDRPRAATSPLYE